MDYWITLRKGDTRQSLSAASAEMALAIVEDKRTEGFEEIRIIDPHGRETNAHLLWLAVNCVKIEPA